MSETTVHKPGDKPKGWFSRRHRTNDAHKAAVEKYRETHHKERTSHPHDSMTAEQLVGHYPLTIPGKCQACFP